MRDEIKVGDRVTRRGEPRLAGNLGTVVEDGPFRVRVEWDAYPINGGARMSKSRRTWISRAALAIAGPKGE